MLHIYWKQQKGGGEAGYEASFCTSHAHIFYLTKMSAEQGSALTTPIMEGSPSL